MKSFQAQSHYEVLEISVGASATEIKSAYERLNSLYSDDQVVLYGLIDPARAQALRVRLKEALEVLSDDDRRDAYDLKLGLPPRDRPRVAKPKPAPSSGAGAVAATGWGSYSFVSSAPTVAAAPSSAGYTWTVSRAAPEPVVAAPPPPPPPQPSKPTPRAAPPPAPTPPPPAPLPPVAAPAPSAPPPTPAPAADVQLALEVANTAAANWGVRQVEAPPPPSAPPVAEPVVQAAPPTPPPPMPEPVVAVAAPAPVTAPMMPPPAPSAPAPAPQPPPLPEPVAAAPQPEPEPEEDHTPRLSDDDVQLAIVPLRTNSREFKLERPKPYEVPPDVEFNGDLLKQVRMARGLSLAQLAERTRIGLKHLENVEGDRYDALPAGVYLRGILMNVARELGLDGLRVSKSYLTFVEAHRSKG